MPLLGTESRFFRHAAHSLFTLFFNAVRTMHFGLKLYNDQRNTQVFHLFIYLLLPYTFWAFFKSIFRGMCTDSAAVQVSWVWCQRLLNLYTWLWRRAERKPKTCKAKVNRYIN
jgi:hypothetical protein